MNEFVFHSIEYVLTWLMKKLQICNFGCYSRIRESCRFATLVGKGLSEVHELSEVHVLKKLNSLKRSTCT